MGSNRKLLIIINPHAGAVANHGADSIILEESKKLEYTEEGIRVPYDIDVRFTRYPGHATELAREAVINEYYGVLACGGDGTVNEAARGVCGSKVALGVIPMGSGNGLARHLGIPLTIPGAMKVINEDRVLDSDYATANGRPFFCTFGVGFDAEVTDKFNKMPGRGLKNYIRTAFEEYFSYKASTYTIIANGKRITENALLVAVCNASQYGNNAYIAPEASIKDGLLDTTIVHKGNLFADAISAIDMLSGLVGKGVNTNITTFKAKAITIIRNGEGSVHFDGEPATLDREIRVRCHHGNFKIFATEKKAKLRAALSPEIPILSPLLLTLRDLRYRLFNMISPLIPPR